MSTDFLPDVTRVPVGYQFSCFNNRLCALQYLGRDAGGGEGPAIGAGQDEGGTHPGALQDLGDLPDLLASFRSEVPFGVRDGVVFGDAVPEEKDIHQLPYFVILAGGNRRLMPVPPNSLTQ